jgi:hypothetical protein
MKPDINAILKIYLGTNETGRFQPIGCDDRLRRAFPADHEEKRQLVARYLKADRTPDWSKNDLIRERDLFAETLRKEFPELDEIIVKSLANRFAFGWR